MSLPLPAIVTYHGQGVKSLDSLGLLCYGVVTSASGKGNKVTITPCRLFASLVTILPPPVPARADAFAASLVMAVGIRARRFGLGRVHFFNSPASAKGLGTSA